MPACHLPLLLFLLLAACDTTAQPADPKPLNSVDRIIEDMTLPHEGRPHGVADAVNWSARPRMGMGNNPRDFRAITAWGQVYEDRQGSTATNTRVHLRNIRTYVLSKKDGRWHRVQSSTDVSGAAYKEDFAEDVNRPAEIRKEPGGGVSVVAGGGYNFHFWPTGGRAQIDPADIAGVFTTCQARLVLGDPNQKDDRDAARLMLGMGADYWLDTSAAWDHFKTNGDVAIGRFRYVRKEWQPLNMTSLSPEEIRRNPPPLE